MPTYCFNEVRDIMKNSDLSLYENTHITNYFTHKIMGILKNTFYTNHKTIYLQMVFSFDIINQVKKVKLSLLDLFCRNMPSKSMQSLKILLAQVCQHFADSNIANPYI